MDRRASKPPRARFAAKMFAQMAQTDESVTQVDYSQQFSRNGRSSGRHFEVQSRRPREGMRQRHRLVEFDAEPGAPSAE